jgi:hypothetical protein
MIASMDNGNWEEVAAALARQAPARRGGDDFMARVIAANARAAEAAYFDGAKGGEPLRMREGSVVRTFWWGFHVQISHEDLPIVLATAAAVNNLVDLIGGNIPSPAQPWIKLIALFIAGAIQLVRALDVGRGVYISMSWFAAGVFVPTSV